jgi:dienelactone hydrolase
MTIWGTLNFPTGAPDKNVPVVVLLHGMGGISEAEEHWLNVFNSMGLATFMVDSNWARRKCKKDNNFKKAIPFCAAINRGMGRVIDGYGALELLSKHPRIDPKRIGCLGISLGARGCLYLNVKRFQKMWGTPGLDFAASVPMYPPCNATFKEDDEITDTPIRIHVGELDTYFPVDSCINYIARLKAKGKDVDIKVYPDTHHSFETKTGGKKIMKERGHNDGRCYYEENPSLPVKEMNQNDVAILSQVGFNEWYAGATEKEKKKALKYFNMRHKFGWRLPQIQYDKSCVSKSTTMAYNKASSEEAEKLVREFFTATLKR